MFKLNTNMGGYVAPFEYVTAGAAFGIGCPLKLSGGKAVKCAATDMPELISVSAATANGDVVAVQRVEETQEYETTLSAAPAEEATLDVGDKVTIGGTNMDEATATKTSGVFMLTYLSGTAVGDVVRGYFRR